MKLQYIIFAMAFLPNIVKAQTDTIPSTIERDVDVVNTYLPTISNPSKLQVEPNIDDTMSYKPTFKYETLTKVQTIKTNPDSLTAATMTFKAEESPYNTMIRVGGGNYTNFAGEILYNIGNSDKYHLGLNLGHFASLGKIKMENGEKIKAPLNRTWANVDFDRYYKKNVLGIELGFENKAYEYYGLQTIEDGLLYKADTDTTVYGIDLKDDKKQRTTAFDMDVKFNNSIAEPREGITYNLSAGFGLFSNKTGVKETDIRFDGKVRFPIKKNYLFDAEVGVNNFKVSVPNYNGNAFIFNERSHTDISMKPHFGLDFDNAKLRVGLNFILEFGDEEDEIYMQPDMYLDFNIAADVASFYLGIIGGYQANSFRQLVTENPYLASDASNYVWRAESKSFLIRDIMPTTQNPIRMVAGLKAHFSNKVSMHVGIDYKSFDDELFYVNKGYNRAGVDTTGYVNMFGIISENGKVFKAQGEFNILPTEKSQINIRGVYYSWNLNYLEEPWYKPRYELGIDARFYPIDRLLITMGMDILGDRYAFDQTAKEKRKLDTIFDINIGGEYQITSRFTGFVRFNNLAAQDYMRWLGYSSQKFNALVGITYKF